VRVHFLVNTHRQDAISAAQKAAEALTERGVELGIENTASEVTGIPGIKPELMGDCDLAVTFGGDGTLIRASHFCSAKGTPILGVYYGRFGFVTQCDPKELGAALSQVLDGKAEFETRMMLQATLLRQGRELTTVHCLNEATVQRAVDTRMLNFEIQVDGKFLTQYPADGVIIATPTGSTGYNLSAGGPIIDPSLEVLALSAIAPHTLSARPIILASNAVIEVAIETRGDAILSADGQYRFQVFNGDHVRVTRSERVTRLVSLGDDEFLSKLTDRLLWAKPLPYDEGESE
jgi:NAD+ kinase